MQLADIIKEFREKSDLSQRQFAAKCGLSNGYISMIENGINPKTKEKITPTITALKKLSKGMNMSLDSLFMLADDMDVDISYVNNELSIEEQLLIKAVRKLNEEGIDAVNAYIELLLGNPKYIK